MKFCKVVVHGLTNDSSCDAKLKKFKNGKFWGKMGEKLCLNRENLENICFAAETDVLLRFYCSQNPAIR